jgi:hypothetical protein
VVLRTVSTDTLYSGACVDCGARTNGNDGPGKAAERCRPCRHEFERANAPWSREGVIHAIQEFAETYGRPPRVTDFSKAHAAARGHAGRVPEGHWPALATIQILRVVERSCPCRWLRTVR